MGKRYDYDRLYMYCVKDDFKTSKRGIIRRKSRVSLGVFSYISISVLIVLEIMGSYLNVLLSIMLIMCLLVLIYWTRTGPITYLNMKMINNTIVKENQSILEKFALYHNRDGNYIKIQDKQMVRIKYHPFNWTVVKIVFKDNNNNKYVFRISLKSVFITVVLSKSRRDNYIENVERKTKIQYQYNLNDLKSIKSAKDFMIFIRDKYRQIRETISC